MGCDGDVHCTRPILSPIDHSVPAPGQAFSLRYSLCALLLLFVLGAWGCASDQKKPTPVTTKVGQIQKALSELADAYGKKNKEGFLAGVEPSAESYRWLDDRTSEDFKLFSRADLSIKIQRIELGETASKTTVHWKGVWRSEDDLPVLERRGNAIFLMAAAADDPKLIAVLGDSPFDVFR